MKSAAIRAKAFDMPASFDLRDPTTDDERSALSTILQQSYGYDADTCATWLAEAGHDQLRILRRGGEVVGGSMRLPMGQFFGGRSVRCCGVTGVAIAPQARGRGAATALVQGEVRALAEEGWALSTLWGATEPLYRRAGYAIAGGYYRLETQVRDVVGGARDLPMRAFAPDDEEAVRALYRDFAAQRPGWLDRGPFAWGRTRLQRGTEAKGFVVIEDDRLVGYVFVRHQRTRWGFDLELSDMVYAHRAAARTLLAFFADQRSLGERITWMTAPDDALPSLLKDRHYELRRPFTWMMRILDVEAALEQRGYPPQVEGRLALEVADDVIPRNDRRFVLEVTGGQGRVERGGSGDLRLDVRALAPLYSGHHGVGRLREIGRLDGSEDSLALAQALFTGPPPSCADFF